MSLIHCTKCGHLMSTTAPRCPGCGMPPYRREPQPPANYDRLREGMDRAADDLKAPDARRITLGFVIAWAWAVIAGIPGIMMLFEDKAGAGICFILAALVALPPANAYAAAHWRIALSGWLRFVIIIALTAVAGSLSGSRESGPIPGAQSAASPSTPAAAPKTLLDIDGNGSKTTEKFTTQGDWDLRYSYDCSAFGGQGNFQVYIYNGDGSPSFANSGVNQLGASGSDVDHYHTGGTFYLVMNSECRWHVQVIG